MEIAIGRSPSGDAPRSPPLWQATPVALLKAGIYATIAVALKGGMWRHASMVMLTQTLAAKPRRMEPKPVGTHPASPKRKMSLLEASVAGFVRRNEAVSPSPSVLSSCSEDSATRGPLSLSLARKVDSEGSQPAAPLSSPSSARPGRSTTSRPASLDAATDRASRCAPSSDAEEEVVVELLPSMCTSSAPAEVEASAAPPSAADVITEEAIGAALSSEIVEARLRKNAREMKRATRKPVTNTDIVRV